MVSLRNNRIIIIDDNQEIRNDYRTVLSPKKINGDFSRVLDKLFEEQTNPPASNPENEFAMDFAAQGEEGFELIKKACAEERPYALAFVDMRMPPGWDGLKTIQEIWKVDPKIQTVICTAYSDYTLEEINEKLGVGDRLLILKKPFDFIEVQQIVRSLTEKWNLARAVEKNTAELEKIISERNGELKNTQKKILHQEKMASMGILAAGVAHEINNPVSFISSNLGALQYYVNQLIKFFEAQSQIIEVSDLTKLRELFYSKKNEFDVEYIMNDLNSLIKESMEGTERVKKIVQNFKNFSRVDESEYKPADINECLENTIIIAWNEIKYKVTLKKVFGEIPPIKCYMQELNQVFLNLLVNAAQAIEKKGEITIKTSSDGSNIFISIADTGSGIAKENIAKIFEPFFTTKEAGKGTGLGLSISCDIIKKHNGEITVQSEINKGTTFTIKIPIV